MPVFVNNIRKSMTEYNIPMVSLLLARRSDYLQRNSIQLNAQNLVNATSAAPGDSPGSKSIKMLTVMRLDDDEVRVSPVNYCGLHSVLIVCVASDLPGHG